MPFDTSNGKHTIIIGPPTSIWKHAPLVSMEGDIINAEWRKPEPTKDVEVDIGSVVEDYESYHPRHMCVY